MNTTKTKSIKAKEINRTWHLFNLEGKVLGRVSTEIALYLIGKKNPGYSPNLDSGDYVVAVNANKLVYTGKKVSQKMYYRHSGYPGGFRKFTLKQMLEKDPRKVLEFAVAGMLPKNKLRDKRLRRLKIFTGDQHPYEQKLNSEKSKEEKNANQ